MELFSYLLEVSACLVLFFACYLLVLRKLTFFKFNRFYLLTTLVLSFAIPALHFTVEKQMEEVPIATEELAVPAGDLQHLEMPQDFVETTSQIESIEETNWLAFLPYAYALIAMVILSIGIGKLLLLFQHTKQQAIAVNGLKLLNKVDGFTNCSFFNYVFIDEQCLAKNELEILLQHEKVHAQQYHSIDKIVVMFAKAILWFNPVIYLWDKTLEQVHEYEADEATSNSFGSKEYASLLLKLAVDKSSNSFSHNFVKSPVKERIKMLFNSKSKNMKKLAYLLVLPMVLGLLWGFTVEVVEVSKDSSEQSKFVLVLDAGHGGSQKGAEVDGYTEKELTLSIAKKIEAIAQTKGIKVVMTRNADENVSLKERAAKGGNVLISLHYNSEPLSNGGKKNGIEVFTAPNHGKTQNGKLKNALASYMLKEFQDLKGIEVSRTLKSKNLVLLRECKVPAVVLELGYLTNIQDFQYITNEDKQDELAKSIVEGVVAYKNSPSLKTLNRTSQNKLDDKLMGATIKGKIDSISGKGVFRVLHFRSGNHVYRIRHDIPAKIKVGDELTITISGKMHKLMVTNHQKNEELVYDTPHYLIKQAISSTGEALIKAPEKQAFLYEANRARFATSKIEKLSKNSAGYVSEIRLNDGKFKILLDISSLKTKAQDFKVGDEVTVKFIGEKLISKDVYTTNQLIVLHSNPKKHQIINHSLYNKFYTKEGYQKVAGNAFKKSLVNSVLPSDIKVISAARANVQMDRGVTYLKEAVLEIKKLKLEAKDVTMYDKGVIIAQDVKFYARDGKIKDYSSVVYHSKDNTFSFYDFTADNSSNSKREGKLNLQGIPSEKFAYFAKDSVVVNHGLGSAYFYGHAKLDIEKYSLFADQIRLNHKKKTILAFNGTLSNNQNENINFKVMEIDLASKKYEVKNVRKLID